MNISLFLIVPENLFSRDGFVRSVPRQPGHFRAQAESGAFIRGTPTDSRGGMYLCIPPYFIDSVRVYRVAQLPTDTVNCQNFTDTGPVVKKVVPVTGAAFAGHHGPINLRLSFHTHYWYEVGLIKVSEALLM